MVKSKGNDNGNRSAKPYMDSLSAVQKGQGNSLLLHGSRPRLCENSPQSPLMWRRAPLRPRGFPARDSRTSSLTFHCRPSCLSAGNSCLANAWKLQWSMRQISDNEHQPLHPQRHTQDLRRTAHSHRHPVNILLMADSFVDMLALLLSTLIADGILKNLNR